MTFLPIVERELRAAARRRSTYWIRLGVAFIGLIVGGWIMLIPDLRRPSVIGPVLFYATSITGMIYGVLVGLFTTADCLSEEKREGTLGLLFLTDLKGYDIVSGKMVATSVNVVYGLLALFPIMAIPLLAGGVTGTEFWRVVLVALNNLFFSLAVGMFCSAISRDERKALTLTGAVLLTFVVVLPLTGIVLFETRRPNVFHSWLFVPSPGYSAFFAFDETGRALAKYNLFVPSVACVHAMSWGLLLAACFIVPRTWQDRAATPAQLRRRLFWQRWRLGAPAARAARRERLLEVNPFYWLAARERFKSLFVWLVFAVMGAFWIWGLTYHPRDWKSDTAYVWTALILHTILKLWMASEACRRFSADRKSGALELLLSTPMPVKEILRGQRIALEKQFALPMFALLIMDSIFLMADPGDSEWVLVCGAGMAMLVADLVTLSWVGMWRGLNSLHSNRAFGAAIVRVTILPWILFALAMTVLALLDHFGRLKLGRWLSEAGAILLWLAIGLTVDAFFARSARRRLLNEFRSVATARFEQKRWWWKKPSRSA